MGGGGVIMLPLILLSNTCNTCRKPSRIPVDTYTDFTSLVVTPSFLGCIYFKIKTVGRQGEHADRIPRRHSTPYPVSRGPIFLHNLSFFFAQHVLTCLWFLSAVRLAQGVGFVSACLGMRGGYSKGSNPKYKRFSPAGPG